MRADFFRPDSPESVVGAAEWDGVRVHLRVEDAEHRSVLERVFRISPVVAHDPSRRSAGASGPIVAEPGDLDWFLAAAQFRGEEEGLRVRFAPDTSGGWDPAGAYRRMGDWLGEQEAHAHETHPRSWR